MSGSLPPTPYADVNAVLAHFLTQVGAVLGDRFRGMYLDGSLALGDFCPETSDIDFVVTTDEALPDAHYLALRALHARFNAGASPWATEVEAVYLPESAFRCAEPEHVPLLRIERGGDEILVKGFSDSTWVTHWYVLREHPVVLAGPDPRTIIDPIAPQDLRRAMVDLVDLWLSALCRDHEALRHRGPLTYTVLTLCRMLYTLFGGTVTSKVRAARWAQHARDGRWSPLIERSLAWRKPPARQDPVSEEERRDALTFLDYTVEQSRIVGQSLGLSEP